MLRTLRSLPSYRPGIAYVLDTLYLAPSQRSPANSMRYLHLFFGFAPLVMHGTTVDVGLRKAERDMPLSLTLSRMHTHTHTYTRARAHTHSHTNTHTHHTPAHTRARTRIWVLARPIRIRASDKWQRTARYQNQGV